MCCILNSSLCCSQDGNSGTALYTLQRPDNVEFSGAVTGALTNTITAASSDITVLGIQRFGKQPPTIRMLGCIFKTDVSLTDYAAVNS